MRRAVHRIVLFVVVTLIVALSGRSLPDAPAPQGRVLLDEPRRVSSPDSSEIALLSRAARSIEAATMYVGHPKGHSGTAFVISKKHRLLVTNAHVAEIMNEVGEMFAIPNGGGWYYEVEKVWFHPDYADAKKHGVALRKGDRWVRFRDSLSPDLAILKLASDGPDLESECILGEHYDYGYLDSTQVGLLGFSGSWPEPSEPMRAVFKTGTVSLLTDFAPLGSQARLWKMVDFTAPGRQGDSGGPIFSKTGRVIAVFAWSRLSPNGENDTSIGIRVDGIWELLDHYGLKSLVSDK